MEIFFNEEFNLDYVMKTFAQGVLINTKLIEMTKNCKYMMKN